MSSRIRQFSWLGCFTVILMIGIASPTWAMQTKKAMTSRVVWTVPDSDEVDETASIWLALTDASPSEDSFHKSPLAVVWRYDNSGWFPVWRLSLRIDPDLVPMGYTVKQDASDNRGIVDIATTSSPKPGHQYDMIVAYDGSYGALGVQLVDQTANDTLVNMGFTIPQHSHLGYPVAGIASEQRSEQLDVHTQPFFTPMGVDRRFIRARDGEVSTFLIGSNTFVEQGDRILLDMVLSSELGGEWRISLDDGNNVTELARLSGLKGRNETQVMVVPHSLVGPFQIQLEYTENDAVVLMDEVDLVAGRISVVLGPKKSERTGYDVSIRAQVETTVSVNTTLFVKTKVSEIVWNPDSLRYEEVPVWDEPIVFRKEIATSPTDSLLDFTFHVPLPKRGGIFRMRYDVEHDMGKNIAFEVKKEGEIVHTDPTGIIDTDASEAAFTVVTYNVFGRYEWPEREPALRAILQLMQPDILSVQELKAENRVVIDSELPHHERVEDPFVGWINEGNIYWSTKRFELVEYGAEDIGICEPWRRLFWVRLRAKNTDQTLLVANAHYTWDGHACIENEGKERRVLMARRTVEALERLAKQNEPVLFMGDLNESGAAIDELRKGGLRDSVGVTGEPVKYTYPADPRRTTWRATIDWQLHSGPIWALEADAVDFFLDDVAPSDHKPVMVKYRL